MEYTSDKLKKIRASKNLSQKQLASLANISEISIRKYEAGQRIPKIETISKLANALDVTVNDLLSDSTIAFNELGQQIQELQDSWATRYLDETEIIKCYRLLNNVGQQEAKKRISELTEIPKYVANK